MMHRWSLAALCNGGPKCIDCPLIQQVSSVDHPIRKKCHGDIPSAPSENFPKFQTVTPHYYHRAAWNAVADAVK